jgi:hypothetical protein
MSTVREGDLVSYRYGEKTLYGTVEKISFDSDGNELYTIFAGEHLYHGIPRTDLLHDFGSER